jgi:uncharacterized protein (TIGR00730 family)
MSSLDNPQALSCKITVFGSSSPKTAQKYLDAAFELGKIIAAKNCICINGGGRYGVMGSLNSGCRFNKGYVIGVIHERFVVEQEDQALSQLLVCEGNDLNERKQLLFDYGDCIVVAPGGVGTLDEMWDAITGKSLKMKGLDHKPICILNIDGYFDGSIQQMKQAYQDSMLYSVIEDYFHVVTTPEEAVAWCINEYFMIENKSIPKTPALLSENRMKVRSRKLVSDPPSDTKVIFMKPDHGNQDFKTTNSTSSTGNGNGNGVLIRSTSSFLVGLVAGGIIMSIIYTRNNR